MRFIEENFGESPLAERFGIEQYPAVFVDEALVAGPWDFYAWPDTPEGRYVPWLEAASRDRFLRDLGSFVDRRLRGERIESAPSPEAAPPQVEALPELEATTLAGTPISRESFSSRITLVEFWATWCPPCIPTLSFLGELEREGREVEVLAVAVSSEEQDVRRLLEEVGGAPRRMVMATDELVSQFGGVLAVPTLMVFDRDGTTAGVFYGAPPDLHQKVKLLLDGLAAR